MKKRKQKDADKLKQWMIRKGLLTDRGTGTRNLYERMRESYEELIVYRDVGQEHRKTIKHLEEQLNAIQKSLNVLESVRQGRWMLLPDGQSGWSGT